MILKKLKHKMLLQDGVLEPLTMEYMFLLDGEKKEGGLNHDLHKILFKKNLN
jgi:hypothetical protein